MRRAKDTEESSGGVNVGKVQWSCARECKETSAERAQILSFHISIFSLHTTDTNSSSRKLQILLWIDNFHHAGGQHGGDRAEAVYVHESQQAGLVQYSEAQQSEGWVQEARLEIEGLGLVELRVIVHDKELIINLWNM